MTVRGAQGQPGDRGHHEKSLPRPGIAPHQYDQDSEVRRGQHPSLVRQPHRPQPEHLGQDRSQEAELLVVLRRTEARSEQQRAYREEAVGFDITSIPLRLDRASVRGACSKRMSASFPRNPCISSLELHFLELHRGGGVVPPSVTRNRKRHRQVPAKARLLLSFLLTNRYI